MAVAFTQEQKDEIQGKLIEAGLELSGAIGFKRMTISRITKAAGVAVGSFIFSMIPRKVLLRP